MKLFLLEYWRLSSEIIAVIDGDEIAYKIAAACEIRTIKATNTTNSESSVFKHRTELKKFLAGLEVPEGHFIIEDGQTADVLANALHSVKVSIESIQTACKADKIEIYLSGKDNFRDTIPLPTKYKSNRSDNLRPLLLTDIRAYIAKKYDAKTVDGEEVDDVVCHRMWDGYKSKQKIIGTTQDKDACGSSGWLFNPEKMTEPLFIDGLGSLTLDSKGKVRGTGRKWGYLQWIVGDPTDCYNPSEIAKVRYGEKSAYKLLEPLQTDKECIQAVYDLYKSWYPGETTYTDWTGFDRTEDVFFIMQMYLDCYWMRRWEGDRPLVREMLTKLEIVL